MLESLEDAAFANPALFEQMYERYLKDKSSLSKHWQNFFDTFEKTGQIAKQKTTLNTKAEQKARILRLIDAYRFYGHLDASFNPLDTQEKKIPRELSLERLLFDKNELSQLFPTCGFLEKEYAPLQEIWGALKATYCHKIGIEYMGLHSLELEKWIQDQIERTHFKPLLSSEQKQAILKQLNKAELLESFLHTKYPGQKRFSLEGAETLIPMLTEMINIGANNNIVEFVLGMTHRGRLNVLCNILNKSYTDIFSEFDARYFSETFDGSGDVKYHKGFFSDIQTVHGHPVKIILTPNPSHLESVDAVVEGQVHAKQIKNINALPLLIHGDASITGQGVVYETLQLYRLKSYTTWGTIHIVINNQIGFTTLPKDLRSTRYCTDIAKAFGAPIFHVNAEDPESCVYVMQLAMQLRQKFHCDVFIDLNCYRKYGHNEGDEPFFTQPIEYKLIKSKKSIRELYLKELVDESILEKQAGELIEKEFKQNLQEALKSLNISSKEPVISVEPKEEISLQNHVETGVDVKTLQEVGKKICTHPEALHLHPKVENLLKNRLQMINGEQPIDWGMAELLAYGTLLWEGTPVRLAGQDVARGTFSHRHALWMDQEVEVEYYPLNHLRKEQGRADIVNSPLSEFAALGFEFGYSLASPETLVIWEAQFGDFANGAQVLIDQYITTSEQKWGQKSSLVLFLPHGYEGQGPEHSSGRIERFLTLTGDRNIIVTNPTTPAQFFHLLRSQMKSQLQKPLIVFTPKVLLRHPACISTLKDFTHGNFQKVIGDEQSHKNVNKLIFCSGKIYYDLMAYKEKEKKDGVVFIRLEQLYPFPTDLIKKEIQKYPEVNNYMWVQEEPKNMGAWNYLAPQLQDLLPQGKKIGYVGRIQRASPAVGSYAIHAKEQTEMMKQVFS